MASRVIPVATVTILIAAAVLAIMFFTTGEIRVEPLFEEAYAGCMHSLGQVRFIIDGVVSKNVKYCMTHDAKEICEAVVLGDESRCGNDTACIAFVRKDASRCAQEDVECRAFISGDDSLCNVYSFDEFEDREMCKALAKRDSGYFSSREAKQNCLDSVVFRLAQDVNQCNQISNSDVKRSCKEKFPFE